MEAVPGLEVLSQVTLVCAKLIRTKQHRKALGHGDFKVNGGNDDFKVLFTN